MEKGSKILKKGTEREIDRGCVLDGGVRSATATKLSCLKREVREERGSIKGSRRYKVNTEKEVVESAKKSVKVVVFVSFFLRIRDFFEKKNL